MWQGQGLCTGAKRQQVWSTVSVLCVKSRWCAWRLAALQHVYGSQLPRAQPPAVATHHIARELCAAHAPRGSLEDGWVEPNMSPNGHGRSTRVNPTTQL